MELNKTLETKEEKHIGIKPIFYTIVFEMKKQRKKFYFFLCFFISNTIVFEMKKQRKK